MQKFEITLKNEKSKLYERLSWYIIIIFILLYIYLSFFLDNDQNKGRKIAFLAAMAVMLILKFYFAKTKYRFGSFIFFYFLIAAFIASEYYLLAVVSFFFQILQLNSTRRKIVVVSKEKIHYPSFPARSINWYSLNNCLLKDGLLTIDLKNNKIIQQIIDEEKTTINEQEFNEFCQAMLKAIKPSNN